MLEQKTMQQGLELVQQYGPVTGVVIYVTLLTLAIIAWNIWQQLNIKRNVSDPTKEKLETLEKEVNNLRHARGDLLAKQNVHEIAAAKEVARLELMINERVKYEWAENHLIPKMDKLSQDITRYSANVDHQSEAIGTLSAAVKHLSGVLESHAGRLQQLEHK